MSDHKHGEMNSDVQQKTFDGFLTFMSRSAIVVICILIFMALVNG